MASASRQLRLPPMPKMSEIIRMYGLTARKQLSQNFILDLNVTDKISRKSDVFDCHVVEVGAGPGSLTRSLLKCGVRHLHAVEIDNRFLPSLQILEDCSEGHMSIHHNDIMDLDIARILQSDIPALVPAPWDSDDLPNVRMVGNLPFSVSISLLLQWLEALADQKGPWKFGRVPMTLVFQKEVGENLTAVLGDEHRSRLSVMAQNYCHVTRAMVLHSGVFVPRPQVDAWLVHFIPRQKFLIDSPFNQIEQVVKAIYSMRRKQLRYPLRTLFPDNEHLADELMCRTQIAHRTRSWELKFEDYNLILKHFLCMCEEYDLSTHPHRINKPDLLVDNDSEVT